MRMSIAVMTILNLMRDRPMCGVALEKVADKSAIYNVYTLLKRLEAAKVIEYMPGFQPEIPEERKSRPKRWYRITALGIKMLEDAKTALS